MVAFGVWLAACSGRAVGFCIIGCDLNYALPGGQARAPQVIRPPGERGGQQPGALPGALLLSGRHPCEVSRAVLACTRRCWTSPRSFRPFSVRASLLRSCERTLIANLEAAVELGGAFLQFRQVNTFPRTVSAAVRATRRLDAPFTDIWRTASAQRMLSRSFMQVRGHVAARGGAVCKTVGSAYVGSNPTPATTCENGPRLRKRGRRAVFFLSRRVSAVCHCGSMCCGVHGRIADGVRAARTVGAHRRLFHGRPRTAVLAAFPGLTCAAESGVHPRVPARPCDFPGRGRAGKALRWLRGGHALRHP